MMLDSLLRVVECMGIRKGSVFDKCLLQDLGV